MYTLLADALLVLHFLFVVFVVASVPLIWAGALAGWSWVKNRRYRIAHLAAILFVTAEALLGMMCPLTVWEDALRGVQQERGFVARWLHRVLYYQLPEEAFVAAYAAFAVVVAATYYFVPPRRGTHRGGTAD
jgi:polyferredoxin